jgi:MYXO-CTERM domain-containing protein
MKRMISVGLLCMGILAGGRAAAATYDLSGEWTMNFTAVSHTGPCPAGVDFTGAVIIEQTGDNFVFTITSGTECNPAFTCIFTGTVSDADYHGSNSGDVPTDGHVENTMDFTASSEIAAAGSSSSIYTAGTTECTWQSTLTLSREAVPDGDDEDGGGETVTEPVAEGGPDAAVDPAGDAAVDPAGDAAADGGADVWLDGSGDGVTDPSGDQGEGSTEEGCGCSMVSDRSLHGGALLLLLFLLVMIGARRR